MGKSNRKNRNRHKDSFSYYSDDEYDQNYNSKKYKKNRFRDRRKNKEIQQRLFVDWDTL